MYAAFRQVQALAADIKPTAPAPVNKTVLTLTESDKTGQLSLFDF
jgi:hypothetical protein